MQLIHVDDVNILLSALDAAYKKNIDTECEVRLVLPNKKIIWFHITSHPIFNDDGNCEEFTGVAMEITNRKKAQEKIAQLNEKLVVSARNSGMAEVAVGILHNLGNILNSVNVSINVIKENVDKSYIPKLICVIDLIEKNIDTIGDYITQDKKGKIIPEYLVSLAKALNTQHDTFSKEFINVEKYIRHINNIVDSQQRLAKSSNVISYFSPAEIIDDALNICQHQKGNKDIRYNKCFDRSLLINSDKNKLLQVLVNLFRNANESMSKKNNYLKNEIKVILKKERKKYIKILVKDNGVGIEKENLSNIFSYGYTNKENGHGFGLHSCALFAKEMGGSLEVTSAGADKGATFTLTLPVNME